MTAPGWDAVVLAGGAGSRLGGVDKAALDLTGRPLIDAVLDATVDAACLVVVGDTRAPLPDRAIRTREQPAGSGPAAAVVAGLAALTRPAPWVALLACDLPAAGAALARLLPHRTADDTGHPDATGATHPRTDGAVLTDPDGRPQWAVVLVRRAALEASAARLGDPTGRPLRALLADLDLTRVPADGTEWHDVDTWDDHRTWRHRLAADPPVPHPADPPAGPATRPDTDPPKEPS